MTLACRRNPSLPYCSENSSSSEAVQSERNDHPGETIRIESYEVSVVGFLVFGFRENQLFIVLTSSVTIISGLSFEYIAYIICLFCSNVDRTYVLVLLFIRSVLTMSLKLM